MKDMDTSCVKTLPACITTITDGSVGSFISAFPTASATYHFSQRASGSRSKGLSQRELAERLGVTREMIDYYERRSPNPTLDVMQKIAGALEVSVTELLSEEAVTVESRTQERPDQQSAESL